MQALLDHLRQHYGGVEKYLLAAGVSADEVARLRHRLIEQEEK